MYTIESNLLSVSIAAEGAELQRIYRKDLQLDYLWQGDPAYWAKKSPVLFPVVGALKDDTYYYNDQAYQLPRHGFAREMKFEVTNREDSTITFTLSHSPETMNVYPFPFELQLIYTVQGAELTVTYIVLNKGEDTMFFSIGGHPAFRVPLVGGTAYTNYALKFNNKEEAGRWPVSEQGLIGHDPEPCLQQTDLLPLTKELFYKDAVVLKHLHSDQVTLVSDRTEHGWTFSFPHFPFLGIWAAPDADFVCIEPWCGIADSVNSSQQFTAKEGIEQLPGNGQFRREWKVAFF